jgi:ABC-type multidrug transport system ATPase subunit
VFYSSHLLYEVEPVADEIAILDHGQIVRQAETEELRADVKQIILSREAATLISAQARILDQRPDGADVAIVVEEAESIITALEQEGIEHRVVDLNLDEIFEAYVAGKRDPSAAIQRVAEPTQITA